MFFLSKFNNQKYIVTSASSVDEYLVDVGYPTLGEDVEWTIVLNVVSCIIVLKLPTDLGASICFIFYDIYLNVAIN